MAVVYIITISSRELVGTNFPKVDRTFSTRKNEYDDGTRFFSARPYSLADVIEQSSWVRNAIVTGNARKRSFIIEVFEMVTTVTRRSSFIDAEIAKRDSEIFKMAYRNRDTIPTSFRERDGGFFRTRSCVR